MKDRILEGYLKDFSEQQGLENDKIPAIFTSFSAHCTISKFTSDTIEYKDITTDGMHDAAIDAAAVIVNHHIVNSTNDIEFFYKNLGRLEVDFVFLQCKSGPKFKANEIGSFLFGVKQFFYKDAALPENPRLKAFRQLKEYIYDRSIDMSRKPNLWLFYSTTGKWKNEEYLLSRIKPELSELNKTELFGKVEFSPIDSENLLKTYRELRHRIEKEIQFDKHTIIPKINGVKEAYLGILSCKDYIRFITDDEGNIQRSLFYDNVRDFQGNNPVNEDIALTLSKKNENENFVVLNNGITVVARSIQKIGTSFKISEYQVVNGCQTSHVLYQNQENLTDNTFVTIKLIVTDNTEVINRIIRATNRQTSVTLEAFESLTAFHRKLEEFYNSFEKENGRRLYYERRSRQYSNLPIKHKDIVSLSAQSYAIIAMFFDLPHSTHRYYGEILSSYKDRIFLEDHNPYPYYTSAYCISKLTAHLKKNELQNFMWRFRFHIAMMFRVRNCQGKLPKMNSSKMTNYCDTLCAILWDQKSRIKEFSKIGEKIQSSLSTFNGDINLAHRLRSFTEHLRPGLEKNPRGKVLFFSLERNFGFIEYAKNNIFVHASSIQAGKHTYLRKGEIVEFEIKKTEKGPEAINVKIIPKK